MEHIEIYKSKNKIRFVTAAALFDGHDASINIMRRILQSTGAEVIHLGHNRSVDEVVNAALSEDAQGVAITSYRAAMWSSSNTSTTSSRAAAAATSRSSAAAAA